MQKQAWELKLKDTFATTKLRLDGKHMLTYQYAIVKNRLKICWFYDGEWLGKYCNKDNEIGQLFGFPVKFRMNKKDFYFYRSLYGLKEARKMRKEYEEKIHAYLPTWGSARTLISHLKRNFGSIELLEN